MFLLLGCLTSQTEYDALLRRAQDADQDGMAALAYGGTDCDDSDPLVHPLAEEFCDGVDNDCNGLVDDDPRDPPTWFLDGDGDGFGDDARSAQGCEAPAAHVGVGGDCDDSRSQVNPEQEEVCDDGLDNDCSGDSPECRLEGAYLLSGSDVTWTGASDGNFGLDATPLDSDGDGEQELAVLQLNPAGEGVVYLYETARTPELDEGDAVWRLETGVKFQDFAQPLEAVDLAQDGAQDLVLGLPEVIEIYEGRSGRVYSDTPTTTLRPASTGDGFGIYVFAAGTSTSEPSNGVGTFAFDNSDLSFEAGAAYIWYGERDAEEDSSTADLVIRGQAGDNLSDAGAFAQGDLDADGQLDYFLGASRKDRAYLWYSASANSELQGADADLLLQSSSPETYFGAPLAIGDISGDGYEDLLVSETRFSTETLTDVGAVHIFLGSSTPLSGTRNRDDADLRILGSDAQMFAGGSLRVADLDANGQQDLLIGGWQVYGDAFGFYGPLSVDLSVSQAEVALDGNNGGFCAYSISVADLNSDGNQDILIPCPGAGGGQVRAILGIGP